MFGNDLQSLLSETYALVEKYKTIKNKLNGKLVDYKTSLEEKLKKHNLEILKLETDFAAKIAKEGERHTAATSASTTDIKAIEDAVVHINKFLKAFDAL